MERRNAKVRRLKRREGDRVRLAVLLGLLLGFLFADQAGAQAVRNLEAYNRKLAGRVVDHTRNHGCDCRIDSRILCEKRDVYVYLPPCYDPSRTYPVLFWLHGAFGDEHAFLASGMLPYLDKMIQIGHCPPILVIAPDGTYSGKNSIFAHHSLFVNGEGGRFEDYLVQELLPWAERCYHATTDPGGHAILGISAGGFGGMSIAMRYPEHFGIVAVIGAPINMRYDSCPGGPSEDFHPRTFRWRTEYRPRDVVGQYYFGVVKIRAGWILRDVFGEPDTVIERVKRLNPADLLFTQPLAPGQLDILIHYPGNDNYNFDAHAESFAWLARRQGVELTIETEPGARHTVPYFMRNLPRLYYWLGQRLANAAEESVLLAPLQPCLEMTSAGENDSAEVIAETVVDE